MGQSEMTALFNAGNMIFKRDVSVHFKESTLML